MATTEPERPQPRRRHSAANPPPITGPSAHPLGDPTYRSQPRAGQLRGELPTDPLPIADALRNTPYRAATRAQREDAARAAVEATAAREALEVSLRVGDLMLRCGAGAPQVEASVLAVGLAAGLEEIELDITLQTVLMQCRLRNGEALSAIRVVRSARRDFARLMAVHDFVDSVVQDGYDGPSATAELTRIAGRRRVFPGWVVTWATAVIAGAMAFMLGAGALAALVSVGSAVVVVWVGERLAQRGIPEFYQVAVGAFVATVLAWSVYVAGVAGVVPITSSDYAFMVAGGIVVLLPGRAMASAVEDVISGYQVTGSGRMLAVFLNTGAMVIGVAGGLSLTFMVTDLLPVSFVSPDVLELRATLANPVAGMLGALVLGAAAAISYQNHRRLIAPIAALCALGVGATRVLTDLLGLGTTSAVGVAGVALGFVGRNLAHRLGAPAMVVVVPASFGLLPGLAIFRGLYEMVTTAGLSDPGLLTIQSGITTLMGAMATLLAIATGTVFGELLAAPFDERMSRRQRGRS